MYALKQNYPICRQQKFFAFIPAASVEVEFWHLDFFALNNLQEMVVQECNVHGVNRFEIKSSEFISGSFTVREKIIISRNDEGFHSIYQ